MAGAQSPAHPEVDTSLRGGISFTKTLLRIHKLGDGAHRGGGASEKG